MPLKLYKRSSEIFYLRGTHYGVVVDESTRTRVRADAQAIKEKREREIFDEHVLGRPRKRSFAEAAIDFMKGDRERRYLGPILNAVLNVDGNVVRFGEMLLDDIDQVVLNDLASTLKPNAKRSTVNRAIFTPVMAVLNNAKRIKKYGYTGFEVQRPKIEVVPADWRMPDEIELASR